jgi:hypothetical protein
MRGSYDSGETVMEHITVTVLTLIAFLLSIASPFVLMWLWTERLSNSVSKHLRGKLLWVALVFSTAAVCLLWISVFSAPRFPDPRRDSYLQRWAAISSSIAVVAFVIGLASEGRGRWWTVVTAASVPLSWILYSAMQ